MIYIELIFLIISSILDIKYRKVSIYLTFIIPMLLILISFVLYPNAEIVIRCIISFVMVVLSILFLIVTNIGGADCLIMIIMPLYIGVNALYAILIAVIVSIPYQMLVLKKHKNKVKLTWKKGCKDLRIFIIQGNIIKKFDTEYGFADVKLSK